MHADAKWHFVVLNADSACDPVEVQYQLCLVRSDGTIEEQDAVITHAEHGWYARIRQALTTPMLRMAVEKPQKPKAVRSARLG